MLKVRSAGQHTRKEETDMEIRLGAKIRALRKQKGFSQEVLAQALGVSFQAVSKWETATTLPDVALIPAIASFFGVSTDELFDMNLMEQEQKVAELCREAAACRWSDPARSEQMLRDALTLYPGNDVILNNLLYTLQSPDRREEIVTLCRSILEITRDNEVKYDVLRILARTYREMGQQELVMPTLQQIPELYFAKLELVAEYTDGEGAIEAAKGHARICRDDLIGMLARLSQLHRESGNTAKAAEYAVLTRRVYAFFEGRTDFLSYEGGRTKEWLAEEVWPKLAE